MSITNRIIVDDSIQGANRIVQVDYYIHTGEILRKRLNMLATDDPMTEAIANDQNVLDEMVEREVGDAVANIVNGASLDIVSEHQLQADYDRRVLGRLMTETNSHIFGEAYTFFQAVESRGGANANQRASYLGITTDDYGMIDDRFSNVNGVNWFLTDEKNQVWDTLPEAFE